MPSLQSHFPKSFLLEYLPSDKELFYKDFDQSFTIKWLDKKNLIIEVTELTTITIHTKNQSEHELPYLFKADFPDDINLDYRIESLKLDQKCHIKSVDYNYEEKSIPSGNKNTKISYKIKISGKTSYNLVRTMKRHIRLDYEPIIVVCNKWNTYKPRVTIRCLDEDLRALFTETGTLKDFSIIDGYNSSTYMVLTYPDLLMKRQGYTIYFSCKNATVGR